MLNNNYHRLLMRQLKKSGLDLLDNPKYTDFLNMINEAYKDFEKDHEHLENILEVSSKELFIANKKLKQERDYTKTKLEKIVNNVGGVIFQTDADGNFTYLNQAWTKYSGYSIAESIGKNYKDFLKPSYVHSKLKFNEIFLNKKDAIEFVFKLKKKSRVLWFEVKCKQDTDTSGLPSGYTGTITNITNLKETEIKLKKASQSKDVFLSTMSHEIRTPLNAVTGLANILLMEDFLPEQSENLKALKYSGEHLLGLINDLLDFDKIKSGKLKITEDVFSLNQLLNVTKSDLVLRAENKGLVFNFIKENDIPDNIIGDKLKLNQIIKNLLSNALKFTENGSISLYIKNLGIDKNKVKLRFKVVDTGIGISKEDQKTIFESFMQANPETSIKYGGTGLGLPISKKLLNIQNSDLTVESKLGEGATFSFEITFKISNRLSTFSPEMIEMQPDYLPIDLKVLVAEDNKMNALILKRLFLKWKVNYEIAENGKELLDRYIKSNFDLILMDLQMPLLNGYEATTAIRNLPNKKKSQIPIIALTAFAQTDIKEKTRQYKMDGFMSKPFSPEKLYNLLKSHSKQKQ